jgi:hypothetical protein
MEKGIRIVSDGTPFGTKVLDLNTGEPIPRIQSLVVEASAGEDQIRATLEVFVDECDIVVKGEKTRSEIQTIEIRLPDEST